MTRRPLVAGNWKMNGLLRQLTELEAIGAAAAEAGPGIEMLICPPATLVSATSGLLFGKAATGGQDCHAEASGAHTGDISAEMLADVGATYVIVGHSERRSDHAESDETVQAKAKAAWRARLAAIVCVGETRAEHEAGETLDVLGRQLRQSLPEGVTGANTVVAYEPVWAIGTGLTPTGEDIVEAHDFIRKTLAERFGTDVAEAVRILYGGSVKPGNAGEILGMRNVDGALVGGASLKAQDFVAICRACPASTS
ncbi:triose-phosphate isomerase [Jiella sonneratiae]|uniref:Triosephosphate isomerase n=1 Tax=Jiella sonneratiae TaxID=2816856 RepID=A0ABS3J5V0_9HYPH|nr:triose-phosphate isomerase [Jiella sonneratiae]MBO0905044.1 triose-phosphate isomerase [Jiella sonneratiae]